MGLATLAAVITRTRRFRARDPLSHSDLVAAVKASDYRFESGRLRLYLARVFGFCYGGDRAVISRLVKVAASRCNWNCSM